MRTFCRAALSLLTFASLLTSAVASGTSPPPKQGRKAGSPAASAASTTPATIVLDGAVRGIMVCSGDTLFVAKVEDGSLRDFGYVRPTTSGFTGTRPPEPRELPAGDYVISKLTCIQGKRTIVLSGPHAKFTLKPGEVVNLGSFELQYHSDGGLFPGPGRLRRVASAMRPEVLEALRAAHPEMMAKAVSRPPAVVPPAELRMSP